MTNAMLKRFRKQLVDYADRARATAGGLEDEARRPTGGQEAGGLSNTPMHLGDVGSAVYTQELNATLLEHEEQVMAEIAAAIERIDLGTYGACESCGRAIPVGRLEVVPYTRFCVNCSERMGNEVPANLNTGRPEAPRGTKAAARERRPSGETSDTALRNGERLPIVDMEERRDHADIHAVGTAGGGTAVGGLAGTNIGDGDPDGAGLEDAMGSGQFDAEIIGDEDPGAYSGASGGAVGGTPAGKRARGGRTHRGLAPQPDPGDSRTGP